MLTNKAKNQIDYLAHTSLFEKKREVDRLMQIREFIADLPFHLKNAASHNWLLQTGKFSLIPESHYTKGIGKNLLNYTAKLAEGDHIFTDHWKNRSIVVVYGVTNTTLNFLQEHFSESSFTHGATAFNRLSRHNETGENQAWLHVEGQQVDLWISSKNRLLFYNKFDFASRNDILYFTLFALEQKGILPTALSLRVSGFCHKGDKLYALLEKYIAEVRELELPVAFKTHQKISPREVRQNINLLGGL